MFDVIVIGGGPAGLSAALMLGRCRRRVLVCDAGRPRNRRSRALHGYLTRDGISPAEFNDLGRAELARYGITFRAAAAVAVRRTGSHFEVSLGGDRRACAPFLLLATGVEDALPDVEGLDACYGRSLFHCPYCDAWEWRDQRLAILGGGKSGTQLALSLKTWSQWVLLCTNGGRLDTRARTRLERNGVQIRTEPLVRVDHTDGMVEALHFGTGGREAVNALFFTTAQHQNSSLALTLGCRFNRRGTVETGRLCHTNVAGVFVAGDASRDAQFVVVAAAEGVKAALAINKAMQRQELAP
jgi:thioredoxin reductase